MTKQKSSHNNFNANSSLGVSGIDIDRLRKMSEDVLNQLVTDEGIFASENAGWKGPFYAWFGRDSAISASLIFEAESIITKEVFSPKASKALVRLGEWQGKKTIQRIGEERGKIPHEVRPAQDSNSQTQERIKKYRKLWFKDPNDSLLKNWDSVDSTPLWIIAMCRYKKADLSNKKLLKKMKLALQWCLNNLEEYDGWAGYKGSELHPRRKTAGLHNQTWKDNYGAYQYSNGSLVEQPIKDVFVNALFWSALQYGAEIFEKIDPKFCKLLHKSALDLKHRFNKSEGGFLFFDRETRLYYFAEALDKKNTKLTDISADVAMCLWAYYENECIIDAAYIDAVISRVLYDDMFNKNAGIRNYSNTNSAHLYNNGYHRGPNTYWPFVSALIAHGMGHFGYNNEEKKVLTSMLKGISKFNSCIELFVQTDGHFEPWHHPIEKQESAVNQAWTAAGTYYATSLLQNNK
jgi:glycogen debranching enzyme